ncbi:unnamed protein product, partial [Mesorhabditis spiculigera]
MGVTEISSAPRDRWLHTQEELMKFSPSRKHMTYEQELTLRQKIGRFINGIADRLNANVERQFQFRTMSICSAIVHANRFFYVHSFRDIDLRDVCLASVFLTAKSDDCPRSPRSILLAWWNMRFGVSKIPVKLYDDAYDRMCFFETMLLQTIGFDLVLEMPHPYVLQQMAALGAVGELREAAYFFASDVLAYTDWSIRYTAAEIAAIVVYAVCIWANHPLPDMSVKQPWFQVLAPQLTESALQSNEQLINTLYEKLATTDRPRNVKDRIKAALKKKTAAAAVEANGTPQNRKRPHDGS